MPIRRSLLWLLVACVVAAAPSLGAAAGTGAGVQNDGPKIIIGHRGACGYLPEHTLESYAFAYAQGADYIEPDLVMTRDGRFICRHDICLEESTNIEEAFPARKREDGHWYAADLTLAEVKQLRAHERLANRFPVGAATFEVPTLEETIELVQGLNKTTGRAVGIYPEIKESGWHQKNGLPMEAALIAVLDHYGYRGGDAKVFVQCFQPEALAKIRGDLKSALPLIVLISDSERSDRLVSQGAMQYLASFANGIGPAKVRIETNRDLVKWAHEAGLAVHAYTFQADDVPQKYTSLSAELETFFFTYGVDGVFVDQPDQAVKVVAGHHPGR